MVDNAKESSGTHVTSTVAGTVNYGFQGETTASGGESDSLAGGAGSTKRDVAVSALCQKCHVSTFFYRPCNFPNG